MNARDHGREGIEFAVRRFEGEPPGSPPIGPRGAHGALEEIALVEQHREERVLAFLLLQQLQPPVP